jgi:2-polyprenyl-3-methyl-5-hydroxy-6-metoxy-1,4-benzoquinol methylase
MKHGELFTQGYDAALHCPACGEPTVTIVDSIATSDLAQLYRSRGIQVASYLGGKPSISRCRCEACDLGFFDPPCAGDERFYEQLQKFSWYYQDAKPEYEFARQYVKEGHSVLEVGCGKGAFRSFLPESVQYVGLEYNDEAVRKARDAGLNVRKQSIEQHAASHRQRYDVVCSFQVLEHVPAPGAFVHACVQALAPNGVLIIAVPAEDSFLAVAANAPLNLPPHHVLRWSDRALENLATRENLSVAALWHEPIAPFHREWQLQTLAHHYFVMLGLSPARLIDRGLRYRVVARLLRNAHLRNLLAQRVMDHLPALQRGHTVVLVGKNCVSVN